MMESARLLFLRRVPLFAELDDRALADLGRAAMDRHVDAGVTIFSEGDTADSVIVLTAGRGRIAIAGDRGRHISLALLEPVSLVGEVAAVDGSPRSATLTTLERSEVIVIPAGVFQRLLGRDAAFATRFTRHLLSIVRRTNDHLVAVGTKLAGSRVIWCLWRLALEGGFPRSGGHLVRPAPTHDQLAEMVGCTRETVTRVISDLKNAGYVTEMDGGLCIQDRIHAFLNEDEPPVRFHV